MTDRTVHFQITMSTGSEVKLQKTFSLDLFDPQLDRFDLTRSETKRCVSLIELADDIWTDKPADTPGAMFAEPLNTVMNAIVEVLAEGIARQARAMTEEARIAAFAT